MRKERSLMDLICLALLLGFFALTFGLVGLCGRL